MANRFETEKKKNPDLFENYKKQNPEWWDAESDYQAQLMCCDTALDMHFVEDNRHGLGDALRDIENKYPNPRKYKEK